MKKQTAHVKRTAGMSDITQRGDDGLTYLALTAGERLAAWNGEVVRFVNDRLRQDAELGLALAKCQSLTEATELQRDWAAKTAQDYLDESTRLFRIATHWSIDTAQMAAERA